MGTLSYQLMGVTVLAYVAAMVAHAAEYAFRARPDREPAPAAVGAAADLVRGRPPTGHATASSTPDRAARLGRTAAASLVVAATVHLATAVTRGVAAGRLPWGNMYEFLLTTTLVGVAVWLVLAYRHPAVRHLGLYVSVVNLLLLGLAAVVYTPVGPLVPALDSYWLVIHVAAAATASGIFLIGFVTAVMYLVRTGWERGRQGFPFTLGPRIPAAATVERLAFRLHAFGFPIWTFAVAAGAIWAEAAWGRYWGWDPKEVWAFIAWVVYAGYLHARATPSVKRTAVAWLAIAGWLAMMMNLFGVNLFFEGLHSYA
jgi:cytochrome c-type biogenesis protein CcsB